MKFWYPGLALVLMLVGAAAADARELTLPVGQQKLIERSAPIDQVSVGDPAVADIAVVGEREALITGKAVGTTDLLVWSGEGEGPERILVRVVSDISGLRRAVARMAALGDVQVEQSPNGVVLRGTVSSIEEHRRLLQLARAYGAGEVTDLTRVLQTQLVSVEVRFASVSSTALQRLGFDWSFLSSSMQYAITGPNTLQSYVFDPNAGGLALGERQPPISDAFNLFLAVPDVSFSAVLGALSRNQLAQILAEPTLTVRSGEEADFIVGGDLPIPVPQDENTIGIEFRSFGIRLEVSAKVLNDRRIVLGIKPEVSEPDFSRGVSIGGVTVPSIARRAASTTVELGDGQSLVLAGLLSSSSRSTDDGVPGLSEVPVLGYFFGTSAENRERQELIIVATPRLVAPLNPSQIPSLPGEESVVEGRSDAEMLLGEERVRTRQLRHGLLP